MLVDLSALHQLPAFAYDDVVSVALAGDQYEIIGTCTISRNDDGRLIGQLSVDRALNQDLFFYYTFSLHREGVPHFTGLQLNVNERPDRSALRLKDMIIG